MLANAVVPDEREQSEVYISRSFFGDDKAGQYLRRPLFMPSKLENGVSPRTISFRLSIR